MKLKLVTKKENLKKERNRKNPIIIAGPCSIEGYETAERTAEFLTSLGVEYMRGGAFKPRTSPYSFQGLGNEGLEILLNIKKRYGLKIVSEILDVRELDSFDEAVDVIQIGSRNMYNYPLLKEAGKSSKTVLLKRGMSATIEEWLSAAEYIALEGNSNIILCERGIRTFENITRNTLDLSCIPIIKQRTDLKIIADPSHGTGVRSIIESMSLSSVAAGADGLIIEMHPEPENALSDGFQSVDFKEFERIYKKIMKLYNFMDDLK